MNHKVTLPELTSLLSERTGVSKRQAEAFLKSLFATISGALVDGDNVKIKELGTFKLTEIDPRKSVDVNTGLDIEIAGHNRISFVAAKSLAERVNAPFELFETVELNDAVTDEMLDEVDDLPDTPVVGEESAENTSGDNLPEEGETGLDNAEAGDGEPDAPEEGADEPSAPKDSDENQEIDSEEAQTSADSPEEYTLDEEEELTPSGDTEEGVGNSNGASQDSAVGGAAAPAVGETGATLPTEFEETAWQPTPREEAAAAETDSSCYDLEGSQTPAAEPRKVPFRLTPPSKPEAPATTTKVEAESTDSSANTVATEQVTTPAPSGETTRPEKSTASSDGVTRTNAPVQNPDKGTPAVPPTPTTGESVSSNDRRNKRHFGRGFVMGIITCLLIVAVAFALWYRYGQTATEPTPAPVDSTQTIAQVVPQDTVADTIAATPVDSIVEKEKPEPDNAVKIEEKKVEEKSTADTKPSDQPVYDVISNTRYLTTMAKAHYGNYHLWPYIYEANKGLGHPDRIRPGTKIKIPDLSKLGIDPKNPNDIAAAKRKGVEIYSRYNTPSKKSKR